MEEDRRKFLKNMGALGLGLGISESILAKNQAFTDLTDDTLDSAFSVDKKDETVISILQTTDVHCQIHPHDELFWEENQIKFRKTGGYAQLATYFEKLRKKIKVGTRIKVLKHKGTVTKIVENKIYFEEDTTGRQTWWFIDFFELL